MRDVFFPFNAHVFFANDREHSADSRVHSGKPPAPLSAKIVEPSPKKRAKSVTQSALALSFDIAELVRAHGPASSFCAM